MPYILVMIFISRFINFLLLKSKIFGKIISIIFLLQSMPQLLWAQYDSLLHKPYTVNVLGIHAMYRDLINIEDSALRAHKAEEIKSFARKNNDKRLELNVDFFLNFWNTFYQNQPKEESLRKLTLQVIASKEENIDFLYPRSLRALAEFYWKKEQNYEKAFEQYLILDKELSKIAQEDYPEMARDLMQIGLAYYFFQDYSVAIKYFKRAIELPENSFNTMVINEARNNLGLCYQQENKLDSAAYYFNQVVNTAYTEANEWKRIAFGNLAANMYLSKHYEEAIPLLEKDFQNAIAVNDNGCAAGTTIILADIYSEKKQLKEAKIYIDYAQEHISKSGKTDKRRLLYPILSKYYAAIGNINLSKIYVDSTVKSINQYNEKFSALKILRVNQKFELQKEQFQQSELRLEKTQKNLLISLVLLLVLVIVLTYFIQKKRQLAKDFKLQRAAQELSIAEHNLKSFAERIQEKNKLIEGLEKKLEHQINNDTILQLQQSTILTDEDWLNFKLLFEKVHTGFLQRLKLKYPSLSLAEIRFISLAKLNFNTKEMATALGVSTQSIRTNWYRIRKKLNLAEEISVEDLVAEV